MKKRYIALGLILGLFLTSCANTASETNTIHQQGEKPAKRVQQNVSCTELCKKTIPKVCPDKLGYSFEKNCQANCENWSEGLRSCISKAKSCDQLDLDFSRSASDIYREYRGGLRTEAEKIQQKSHCTIIDDDYSEIEEKPKEKVTPPGCASACSKYKRCAGFGQGVRKKGMNEAYNTCMNQACPSWSQKTLRCMQKVHINSPMNCAALTSCGLAEYRDQGLLR